MSELNKKSMRELRGKYEGKRQRHSVDLRSANPEQFAQREYMLETITEYYARESEQQPNRTAAVWIAIERDYKRIKKTSD